MLGDERVVEDRWLAGRLRCALHREQRLDHAHDRCRIAARPHLVVLGADDGGLWAEHFPGRLRIDETHQALFTQRVEGDDGHVTLTRFL